jgi:hypothetical protein
MRVKAEIEDEEGRSSVEFSVEEMLGQSPRMAWREMDDEDRMHALEDYAAWLHARQHGMSGRPQVRFDPATLPR